MFLRWNDKTRLYKSIGFIEWNEEKRVLLIATLWSDALCYRFQYLIVGLGRGLHEKLGKRKVEKLGRPFVCSSGSQFQSSRKCGQWVNAWRYLFRYLFPAGHRKSIPSIKIP